MTLAVPSRRAFLAGGLSLLAAPAIVKVSSLMPVKAPPLVSMRSITDYELTLDEYVQRILQPQLDRLAELVCDHVMNYGAGAVRNDGGLLSVVHPQDLLLSS